MKTLQEALAEPREFSPFKPHYVPTGDYLEMFFTDVEFESDRVDETLTVYRQIDSGALVGFCIKGVSLLAEHVVNMINLKDDDVEISLLLLNAMGADGRKEYYYDLAKKSETIRFPIREILSRKAA